MPIRENWPNWPTWFSRVCDCRVMQEDEHLGEEEEILEHPDVALVPAADSAADITPEDSISNRDPKSPTPIKRRWRSHPLLSKRSLLRWRALLLSCHPLGPPRKWNVLLPPVLDLNSKRFFLTKAHDRTYVQVQEKRICEETSHQRSPRHEQQSFEDCVFDQAGHGRGPPFW